jgi:hypothetical protein
VQGVDQILHRLEERVQHMHAIVTDRLYARWLERVRETER